MKSEKVKIDLDKQMEIKSLRKKREEEEVLQEDKVLRKETIQEIS